MTKEYRIYFGKKFSKTSDGYWNCTNGKIPAAHRWVWINYHGKIPSEMIIHHKDHNPDNNDISNLEMMTVSEHISLHWKEDTFDIEQRRIQLNEARKWLSTKEGKEKQRLSAFEGWKKRKFVKYICKGCQKEKNTHQAKSDFCSDACRSRWKRQNKPNPIEIICPVCNIPFLKDKSDQKIYCSRKCTGKLGKNNQSK